MTPEQQIEVLNAQVPEGARIISHCVPTRAFRVIGLAGNKTFRVEQLEAGIWKWHTLSTHTGDEEYESFGPAIQDAIQKQEAFKLKITRARIEQKNALKRAEQEHGNLNPSG